MYAKIAGLSAAAILTATTSIAATNATATTDLNLRSMPDRAKPWSMFRNVFWTPHGAK